MSSWVCPSSENKQLFSKTGIVIMKINPFVYGALVLALFLGIIYGFQAAGIWSISGKVDSSGNAITADPTDVNSIKGWMTLGDIAAAYQVPLEEIKQQFNLPAETDAATAVKDLESDTFDTTALREWLVERLGVTTGAVEEPAPAAAASETQPTPAAPAAEPTVQPQPAAAEASPTEHAAPDRTITGKVTFQQLLDWGVSQEAIEKALGGAMPPASAVIKDYVTGQGLEFASIKTALQAEVDKVP
jgi:hypothetical protein